MFKKFISISALTLALAGCESAGELELADTTFDGEFAPGSSEDFVHKCGDRVRFAYDSARLTPEAKKTIKKQAEWLEKYPDRHATVEGHCDERGTGAYNLALGEQRAHAKKKQLIEDGVSSDRIDTVSYGKERLEDMGHTEDAHTKNRRGVTSVRE